MTSNRTAIIVNKMTKAKISVRATTDHPDSSYGRPVWVDAQGVAYLECDCRIPNPLYEVTEDSYFGAIRIGQQLRQRREQLGLTAKELSTMTGVHAPNISRIEAGTNNPSVNTLNKLCTALGVQLTITPTEE